MIFSNSVRRLVAPVKTAHHIAQAKEAIIQVALEMGWTLRDPTPMVVVKKLGESSVDLEAAFGSKTHASVSIPLRTSLIGLNKYTIKGV